MRDDCAPNVPSARQLAASGLMNRVMGRMAATSCTIRARRGGRGGLGTAVALPHSPAPAARATSKGMFVFISHLSVPEADRPALERHFRERAHLVDAFPGFLYLQLLVPQAEGASYTFLTAWESRQALSEYMRSMEHHVSHSREPAGIMARTTVRHEAFEVLMDSRQQVEWLASR